MISVAAGVARAGGKSWVYSIAPFCYARPFEQIRNDVCMNQLPVRLVGNGGGYAYGSMGATHHALEDYGVMLALPGLRAYIPAFGADLNPMVQAMSERSEPSYLRLGRSELDDERGLPPYAPWRRLQDGQAGVIVVVGPIAGGLWRASRNLPPKRRPALWVVSELGGRSASMAPPERRPTRCSMRSRMRRRSAWPKSTLRTVASVSDFSTPWRSRGRRCPRWCTPMPSATLPDATARRIGIGANAGSTHPRFCCVWPNAPRRRGTA